MMRPLVALLLLALLPAAQSFTRAGAALFQEAAGAWDDSEQPAVRPRRATCAVLVSPFALMPGSDPPTEMPSPAATTNTTKIVLESTYFYKS